MLTALLLLQAATVDIVVRGKRLVEAQAACVRGECTPLLDARASIALAEAQFREGAYLRARRTLAAAVARNRGHAASDPRPVAALYEAYATVALHEGDQDVYRRAVAGQVRTLRENLPAGYPALIAASGALGDMWIKLRNYRQADITLRGIERDAAQAGQGRSAMLAGMKRIWLQAASGQMPRALRMLRELEAQPIARDPGYALALRVLRLRIAAQGVDDAQLTALIARIGREQASRPTLVWAPPLPSDSAAAAAEEARKFGTPNPAQARSSDHSGIAWIDVGFWIRPDGRVAEAEVLRGSYAPSWAPAMIRHVEGRRYTASPTDDGVGVYRVERVTRRSTYLIPAGSLVRRRVPADGFETLDLTSAADEPGAPASAD